MAPTYLFVDESGDMNFSAGGSPYFYFGALSTADPLPLTRALTSLRYAFLTEGLGIDRFHAAEDRQVVRDRVFATIRSVGGFEFDSAVVDKRKAPPSLYEATHFYPEIADYLLGYVPFSVFHQSSVGHACLQAADYCTWAVHKKWRDGELRPYRMIEPFIKSELEIFQRGDERFY
jgi:hypothetical protein